MVALVADFRGPIRELVVSPTGSFLADDRGSSEQVAAWLGQLSQALADHGPDARWDGYVRVAFGDGGPIFLRSRTVLGRGRR